MPRLRTDFFVAAYRLRCEATGAFVVFRNRGHEVAGAVYVVHRSRGGTLDVFAPAPNLDDPDGRAWMLATSGDDERVDAYVARILADDPDAWVIEIEAGATDCRPEPAIDP